MARISTYPIISEPTLNDLLIGTDVEDLNITKNFTIGDIASLIIGGSYVPYVGATENVDLGAFDITSSAFIVGGGLATQFLKADGSLDATVYQPAGNYITQLSGEATASGPGNATVTLSNSAVINKVLTGLVIAGDAVVATDSILTAFGKVQNQINTLVGGVQYKGTWNAATNTPTLVSSVGVQGNYYVVSVAGNTNLNGITDWKLGDWAIFNGSAWEKVDNTDAVISVNGQVGTVVLTTTDIAEGTNLYYTDLRARSAISLTTTGNSGASTYSNLTGILNVPNYTLAGLGGVPLTRELTINGTTFDLSANRSWSVGTVTSIATTGPLTGGTITGTGTIGITQASASSDGYLSSTDWNTFNNKQNALTNPVTGTGTIFTLPMWSGATSLADSPLSYGPDAFNFQYNSATGGTVNFTNIGLTPYTYAIQMNNFGSPRSTVHSYTDGIVVNSIAGTQVSRMFANGNFILGTGVVDNGYKLELSGTLALRASASASAATQVPVFIASPSGTTRELVTRTPAQLLGDAGAIAGTIAEGQVAFGTAANTIGGDGGLIWNNTIKRLELLGTDSSLIRVRGNTNGAGFFVTQVNSNTTGIALGNSGVIVGSGTTNMLFSNTILDFYVNGSTRWSILTTGQLQSNGAQTIQTSTGNLTLTSADNTGVVDIRRNDRALGAELRITNAFNGTGWLAGDIVGTLNFVSPDTSLTQPIRSQIQAVVSSSTGVSPLNMNLTFSTANGNTLTEGFRLSPSSNLLVGTTTDAGFRLDVNGSTRFNGLSTIQGTTASDSGQLAAELLTTGTGDASWTGTDFATGYTHVAGSTTTLTSTLAGVVSTFYQIAYTVTGRTAGSFTIAFGGFTSAALTATGAVGPQATTTGTLVITPTSDFNGTIVLSIRAIGSSSASVTFNSSAGTATNHIRISSVVTNTFIGLNSGRRNTTGGQNTFFGSNAGTNNTTGGSNSFFGESAGLSNTTGVNNSFFGRDSGDANTTGVNNSFFGTASGGGNTTGNNNSFFGISAGLANTTGSNNVSLGQSSSLNNITGSQNVVIGNDAGRFAGAGTTAMTSVDNSIYLGYQSRGLNATGSTNELVIGVNVVGLGSNTTSLGNASTTFGRWYGNLLLGTNTNSTFLLDVNGTARFSGNLTVTATNATGDFATIDGSNILRRRTAAQVLTDIGAQGALTLTTTGTSGAATLISNVLNIPQYTDQFVGTVTSVGLSMPSAFTVSNSPVTSSGTLTVVGAGTAAQYVRGDGTLGDFPGGGGGGGSSVSYYLNGSINQGTFVGNTYYEMSKTPIFGAGTDFSINTNGYIAQFITDANDPESLLIPAGNWNLEFYFSASSGGGSPTFYVELYKYDGATFTLIASNSTNPELISLGTTINPYFSALGVPETVLAATDRLAIRIYVTNAGRTITLHTENSHLCQVITTFTTGLTALNGLTKQVQYLTTGTSGTDFNISSSVATHVFNLPTASAVNRGALSSADWTTFNGKVGGTGASGQVAYWSSGSVITGESNLFWDAANDRLGLGIASPTVRLDVDTNATNAARFVGAGDRNFWIYGDSGGVGIGEGTGGGGAANYSSLIYLNLDSTTRFFTAGTERWRITSTGILQSNGAQTIQTSTGNLTLATAAGNGNINFTPNGTGQVQINGTPIVSGTISEGRIAFGTATNTIGGDSGLIYDNTNKRLGVGTLTPLGILTSSGTNAAHGTTGIPPIPTLLLFRSTSSTSNYAGLVIQTEAAGSNFGLYSNQNGALFFHGGTERWRITSAGILQSNGAQTIQTSTGNLTLTSADNTGIVDIVRNDRALGAELRITNSFNGSGWLAGDIIGTINFVSSDASNPENIRSQIQSLTTDSVGTYASRVALVFKTAELGTLAERWRIASTGVLQSNGAQTIQTSTGILTLATGGGNADININPNGTGKVGVNTATEYAKFQVTANTATTIPALGTTNDSAAFAISTQASTYGLLSGVQSTGNVWMQAQRFTGAADAFNLLLQPSGGNVLIGTATDAGFRLDVNGTARVQDNLTVSKNQNNSTGISVSNTTSGSLSSANFVATSSNGFLFVGKTSATYTTYKQIVGNDTSIYNATSGNISILNDFASGAIKMAAGGSSTAQATLFSTGNFAIGTTTDVASSILTMNSTTKGFLPPRMTAAQRTAIASPVEGLIVYQTDSVIGLYIYANATWRTLGMI
jgi:hypothetical protein